MPGDAGEFASFVVSEGQMCHVASGAIYHVENAEGQHAPLSYAHGSAHLARKQYWAALDDLSMCSLRVTQALASTFGVPGKELPSFPFTPVDPLIVPRENPLDPAS